MLVTEKVLRQVFCTKFIYNNLVFFSISETTENRLEIDKKNVIEFTKDPKVWDDYLKYVNNKPIDSRVSNPHNINNTGLTHEDMGSMLLMTVTK